MSLVTALFSRWCAKQTLHGVQAAQTHIHIQSNVTHKSSTDGVQVVTKRKQTASSKHYAERIADVNMHNKTWRPHKHWQPSTVCNPIEWADVIDVRRKYWNAKKTHQANTEATSTKRKHRVAKAIDTSHIHHQQTANQTLELQSNWLGWIRQRRERLCQG